MDHALKYHDRTVSYRLVEMELSHGQSSLVISQLYLHQSIIRSVSSLSLPSLYPSDYWM